MNKNIGIEEDDEKIINENISIQEGDQRIMNKNITIKKNEKSCFIITPIGEQKSEIFRKITGVIDSVIKPVLSQYDFTDVKAAHEICISGSINNQVIDKIINSDLVVANLTDTNPNVMYELCLRHVVAKPIIHICEKGTILPFDIKGDRTIFYTDDMLGSEELKKEIKNYLKEIDYEKEYRDNPIYNAQKLNYLLKNEINEKSSIETELLRTILNEVTRDNQYNQMMGSTPMTSDNEKEEFLDMIMKNNGVFFIIRCGQNSMNLWSDVKEKMISNGFEIRNTLSRLERIFFNRGDANLKKVFDELKEISNRFGVKMSVRTIHTNFKESVGSFIHIKDKDNNWHTQT